MTFEGVPGLVERKDAYDETTLVVDPARLVEACTHLRDEEGFNFLSDVTAADYLGWDRPRVAGYLGNTGVREEDDILEVLPELLLEDARPLAAPEHALRVEIPVRQPLLALYRHFSAPFRQM